MLKLGELEHYPSGVTHVVSFLHIFFSFHMLDFGSIKFLFSFYSLDFLLKADFYLKAGNLFAGRLRIMKYNVLNFQLIVPNFFN